MFVLWCGIIGNVMYSLSILLYAKTDLGYIYKAAPWLCASIGCVICDLLLFLQSVVWQNSHYDTLPN